jgi:hypothetical protein
MASMPGNWIDISGRTADINIGRQHNGREVVFAVIEVKVTVAGTLSVAEAEADPESDQKAVLFKISHATKISRAIGYLVPWPLHCFHFSLYNRIEMKTHSQFPGYLPCCMKSLKTYKRSAKKVMER